MEISSNKDNTSFSYSSCNWLFQCKFIFIYQTRDKDASDIYTGFSDDDQEI